MKRITVAVFGVFLLTSGVFAQRWPDTPRVGVAVEDFSSASLVNLAAIGVGNASGVGWSGYFSGNRLAGQTVNATLGVVSYNFRQLAGVDNHEIALGFPTVEGLYLGMSWRWTGPFVDGGYQLHALYRPYQWLSLGIKGESLNYLPWMDWGVGVRPLAFNKFWGSRLTLFYDGRVTSAGQYENLASGLRITPLDGMELYTHWDFRSDNLKLGINLSWTHFLLGGEVNAAGTNAWRGGNIQAFASFNRQRRLNFKTRGLMIYDAAQIITDGPRLYAGIRKFRPNPEPIRSLYEFLTDMENIKHNPEIKSVLFRNQAFLTSFSNIIEIEQSLLSLKEAGKKIYFYADGMDTATYALAASVADGIFLSPQASLDVTGFDVTKLYFKDLLARFGVRVYNFRSHDFKTAYNTFSESEMTAEEREALETVYGGLQAEIDRMILDGRGDKLNRPLDEILDQGNWMHASEALEFGLIDGTMYIDEFETWLGMRRYQADVFTQTRFDVQYDWARANRPTIAVIYANGAILPGEGIKGATIGGDSLSAAIRSARRSPVVTGIVIRVNSGGGSALASDIIAREVALCRSGPNPKPVIISMGGSAASGGYMISAPGSRILATPATITGSIGVIAVIPEFSGLLEKFDVGVDTVKTSESADMLSLARPLTPDEEQRIADSIHTNYRSFIELVSANRGMSADEVDAVAQGRIWTGRQAMERGLVDELGGLTDAVNLMSGMVDAKNPRIMEVNPGKVAFAVPGLPAMVAVYLGRDDVDPYGALPEDIRKIIAFAQRLDTFESGEPLYLMPVTLSEMGLDTRE